MSYFDGIKVNDKVKFEIPKNSKIELKEKGYIVDIINNVVYSEDHLKESAYSLIRKNGLIRNDTETAEKALKQIKRFARLLALRDQECPDSRGYEYNTNSINYCIVYDNDLCLYKVIEDFNEIYEIDKVYFKTEKDAKLICNILNENRFDLETE